jgi:hypothetical protein
MVLYLWNFASNYFLLATIHNEKMMAAAISIVQASCGQPHRIRVIPATVTGAMAAAAIPACFRRVTFHRQQSPIVLKHSSFGMCSIVV